MSRPYDVVVVGAGSAGCALARRLSDGGRLGRSCWRRAASDDHPQVVDPYEYFNLWGSDVDWQYESVAQPGTAGRRPRAAARPRAGRHEQPQRDGLPARLAPRTTTAGRPAAARAGAGRACGRRSTSSKQHLRPGYLPERNPLSQVFIDAAVEAGLPFNPDFDEGTLDGCGWNRSTIAGRTAAQLLPRVPPSRPRSPQPRGPLRRGRRAAADRRAGRRDRRRAARFGRGGGADHGRRGHRHRRCVRLAAAPAALRHRPGGRPRGRRHRPRRRPARRRATSSTTC